MTEKEKKDENKVDLDALAEKVFELMKKDARIERERLGRARPTIKR